jgi:hypothetical protein
VFTHLPSPAYVSGRDILSLIIKFIAASDVGASGTGPLSDHDPTDREDTDAERRRGERRTVRRADPETKEEAWIVAHEF